MNEWMDGCVKRWTDGVQQHVLAECDLDARFRKVALC
jgi:hypothetical protein